MGIGSQSSVWSQQPSVDPAQLQEAAAQQLTTASLNAFNGLPNPQVAYEAIANGAGATAAVKGALSSQDPQFRSLLSSLPAGSSDVATPPPAQQQPPPNAGVYSFDWNHYWKQGNADALRNDSNASWRSFGEVPQLNVGYMQGVAATKDPNRIRQWQKVLNQQGFGGGFGVKQNGVWDQPTQAAFQAMMVSRAIPQALYAQDPTQQAQARQFLGALGVDTATLQSMERDPAQQHALVVRWLMAQGPDQKVGDKSELDNFSAMYGKKNLPHAWQQVLDSSNGSWWDNLFGGVLSLETTMFPGLKQGQQAAGQERSINLMHQLQQAEGKDQAKADAAVLQPLIQNVQDNQGFMGFLDAWDRIRTNALLSTKYFFQDALTFHDNAAALNPFDPASHVGQQVAAADGDFFRGWLSSDISELKGASDQQAQQQAVDIEQQYPWFAAITNTVVNVADDPISYIPNVAAEKVPLSWAKSGRTMARMLGEADPELSAAAARDMVNRLRTGTQQDTVNVAMKIAQHPQYHGVSDTMTLLGGAPAGERGVKVIQAVQDAVQSGDADQLMQVIHDNHLDFRMMSGNSFLQWRTRLRDLQKMQDLRRSDIVGHSAMGSLDSGHIMVNARTDLGHALEVLQERMALANMPEADIRQIVQRYAGASEEQRLMIHQEAVGKWIDAMDKKLRSIDPNHSFQDLLAYDDRLASGRSLRGTAKVGGQQQISEFGLDPRTGERVSVTDLRDEDPVIAQLNQQIRGMDNAVEGLQNVLDGHDDRLGAMSMKGDPQSRADAERQLAEMQGEQQRLRQLRDTYRTRPAPEIPSQLADRMFWPVSNYSVAAYLSPTIRNWDAIANNVLVNSITSMWKPMALARMSTFMRIVIGEDSARVAWELMFSGGRDTLTGAKLLLSAVGKLPVTATAARLRIAGHTFGLPGRIPLGKDTLVAEDGTEIGGYSVGSDGSITDPEGMKLGGVKVGDSGKVETVGAEVPPGSEPIVGATLKRGRQIPLGEEMARQARQQLQSANAMDLVTDAAHSLLPGTDSAAFVPYAANMSGYDKVLPVHIEARGKDPLVKGWIKAHGPSGDWNDEAAVAHLREQFTSDDPAMKELRRLNQTKSAEVWAQGLNGLWKEYARRPDVRAWLHRGSVDRRAFEKALKNTANDPNAGWPIINAPRQSLMAEHRITQALNAYPNWMFHEMLQPMLTVARSQGMMAIRNRYLRQLQSYYKGQGLAAGELENEADALALRWMKDNIYMGARTVRVGAMRNVFPFSGATSNMSRFYLRQALTHPYSGDATLRIGAWAQQQQQNNQQYAVGGQGILAHLGFSGGTALRADPFHMLFITSDGIDSFFPGLGPIFTPLVSAVASNQDLAESLHGLPWISNQIDYQTGAARPVFPWLADLLSGLGTATTGQPFTAPFGGLGLTQSSDYIQRQANLLIQQRAEQGQPVTEEQIPDVYREVGRKLMLEGGLSWSVPMTPSLVDEPGEKISNAMKNYDLLTSDKAKTQMFANTAGVTQSAYEQALTSYSVPDLLRQLPGDSPAILMAYWDSRVTSEQRDEIEQEFPWVTTWSTSMYNKPVDPDTGKPVPMTLAEFQQNKAAGNVTLMSALDYTKQIEHSQQLLGGWLAADALNQQRYDFMRTKGVNSQDPMYKQWDATVYQPQMAALSDPATSAYPAWANAFGRGAGSPRTFADLANVTAPLRTLQTLEVIPMDPQWETPATTLWRQALLWQQQASQQIASLQSSNASSAEVELVMQGLQQRLAWLGSQDPSFAAQLDRYSFGKWQDVVNYEADELRYQQMYGSV